MQMALRICALEVSTRDETMPGKTRGSRACTVRSSPLVAAIPIDSPAAIRPPSTSSRTQLAGLRRSRSSALCPHDPHPERGWIFSARGGRFPAGLRNLSFCSASASLAPRRHLSRFARLGCQFSDFCAAVRFWAGGLDNLIESHWPSTVESPDFVIRPSRAVCTPASSNVADVAIAAGTVSCFSVLGVARPTQHRRLGLGLELVVNPRLIVDMD